MDGKVCLITGASAGIGKATAKELARMGATVVLLCRDPTKGESAQREILQSVKTADVRLMAADLSVLSQVRSAALEFKRTGLPLHVLINNAGAPFGRRTVTVDGFEVSFATNYLSHFLLTNLLLDVLKESAPSRIINVSSSGHANGRINFDDLQSSMKYSSLQAYFQSKLAQVLFTYELADRLKEARVTVNVLHPGIVASNFNRGTTGIVHVVGEVVYWFRGITAEEGAATSVYLASSPAVEGISGKYFFKCKQVSSSKLSHDPDVRRRLWQISRELVEPYMCL
jgi:NAD(P)-dependent dehydrogenase (short-subunit alcohol dehydrogenase family)